MCPAISIAIGLLLGVQVLAEAAEPVFRDPATVTRGPEMRVEPGSQSQISVPSWIAFCRTATRLNGGKLLLRVEEVVSHG